MKYLLNDLGGTPSIAVMTKLSALSIDIEHIIKEQLKKRFEVADKISERLACVAYAQIMQWHTLAAYFTLALTTDFHGGQAHG